MRSQTLAAADRIERWVAPQESGDSDPAGNTEPGAGGEGIGGDSGAAPPGTPDRGAAVSAAPPASPAPSSKPVAARKRTLGSPIGVVRFVVLVVLLVGALAALAGPILLRINAIRAAALRRSSGLHVGEEEHPKHLPNSGIAGLSETRNIEFSSQAVNAASGESETTAQVS
jgi:hypothetical protein